MDIAIIIGGNVGIGLAVSRKLIVLGFRVYAIGADFTKTPFAHKDFIPVSIGLGDSEGFKDAIIGVIEKEDSIYAIINAPEKACDPLFDFQSVADIQAHLTQYLLNPILLARLAINKIKQFQGFIINISHENPSSPLSCTVEGGLSAFYNSLFEDCRACGVNITDILIESTMSSPVNFEMVANTIDHLIRFKGGNAVTKISLRAQDAEALTKFPQITPAVDEFREIQLPPKCNFPAEQEPILTEEPRRVPQKRKSSKPLSPPKVSRETVVIQREKKIRMPEPAPVVNKPLGLKSKRTPRKVVEPKSIASEPSLPVTKISRDSVIIPREKKSRIPKVIEGEKRLEESVIILSAKGPALLPTPVLVPARIRRGRPPANKG